MFLYDRLTEYFAVMKQSFNGFDCLRRIMAQWDKHTSVFQPYLTYTEARAINQTDIHFDTTLTVV